MENLQQSLLDKDNDDIKLDNKVPDFDSDDDNNAGDIGIDRTGSINNDIIQDEIDADPSLQTKIKKIIIEIFTKDYPSLFYW
eukprot:CAMPEP_0114658422 /NCGR_PEP_ID=MMETSP0191-20121206/15711_1 /TAXON_ID=126664 /ORGANISM="Sorites sp." /LENGTH=81 /DNA_ID=CAMNT_0001880387 /DNA_START=135 /DNA_END=377 /DNA_ORIENTATION=+